MAVYGVTVGVSLARPIARDTNVFVVVSADNAIEAELLACQMAGCDDRVVMPVASRVEWRQS